MCCYYLTIENSKEAGERERGRWGAGKEGDASQGASLSWSPFGIVYS